MSIQIEVGDLVFLPPRGSAKHFGRGIVVAIKRKWIIVRPIPGHGRNEKFRHNQVRLWKSEKKGG